MPPGFGKSWVNLLVCMYLKKIEKKTAVYVAINQGLLNQIKSKIRSIPNFDVKAILSS